MAPVEVDYVPASIVPAKNLKVVNKAMELPLVNSAYSEVTRIASPITPYVETTLTKVSPMVEAGYQTIKSQVEEKVVPHIPANISETVSKSMSVTLETVTAAVEKADCYACCGIDQLTEKVPQLKDATPKLLEETKDNVSSYITAATDYTASFSLAHFGLKLVDAGLTALEGILTKVGSDQDSLLVSGVRKVHSTANTIRLSALKKAGTEKAQKIEEASILEAVMLLFGIPELMQSLGFKQMKTETETVYEDEVSRVEVEKQDEGEEPVVVDTADIKEVIKDIKEVIKVIKDIKEVGQPDVEKLVEVDTEKVEEPVEVDTEEVEKPVEVENLVELDTKELEKPVVVDTADTEEVEEAVEVDTAYSENVGEDTDSE